jgi:hypothetical protein
MSRRLSASAPNSTSSVCAPTCAGPPCRPLSLPPGTRRRRRSPGAGAAQVPDALRPPARAGALGWPRRIRRHVGAAVVADQLGGAQRRPSSPSNKLPAARCLAPHRCLPPPPRRRRHFRRQVSPSTRLRRGTWGRRSWAGSCSTGGRTMAGSTARSPASARAARSRTWWPTPGRRRRCAARRADSLLLDSASYGARWVLLSPAPAAGVVVGSQARRPRP